MLSLLRRGGFIQFVMAGIVMLIIAAFAFDYRIKSANVAEECVVRLQRKCVPPKDFTSAFRLSVPPQLEPEQIRRQGLRKQVVDGLIERELLLREAEKLGVGVSEDELDKELGSGRVHYSLPAAKNALRMNQKYQLETNDMVTYIPVRNSKTKDFDFTIYKRSVMNFAHMSTKDFKDSQEAEVIASRMRALIESQVRVSDAEAFAQYSRDGSKAVARIAHVPRSWFARFAVFPTAEQQQEFAKTAKEKLDAAWESSKGDYSAGCADISEIVVDLSALNEEEKAAAKKELQDVQAKLASAEDFAMAARSMSSDPSAVDGGRVGCFSAANDVDLAQVQEAVADLPAGKVSSLIVSETSARLVRVNAKVAQADLERTARQIALQRITADELAQKQVESFAAAVLAAAQKGAGLEQAVQDQVNALLASSPAPKQYQPALQKKALAVDDRPKIEISGNFPITGNPLPTAAGSIAPQLFGLQKPDDLLPAPVATDDGMAVVQLKEKTP
ncbi:MAG TPA: SurA N-terminal domain-containing protein, partial [Polyangiaceae bacterium]|nr:SurA N-terminal domain-containing protein [Polyangiaceae bacterium]